MNNVSIKQYQKLLQVVSIVSIHLAWSLQETTHRNLLIGEAEPVLMLIFR